MATEGTEPGVFPKWGRSMGYGAEVPSGVNEAPEAEEKRCVGVQLLTFSCT